jgi:alkylhydroperoxidase family enzyme
MDVAWIESVPEERADEELARLYEHVRDPITGGVDHIMRVHSLHPAGLSAHFELYRTVMRGTPGLPRADREMIAVVVSRLNDCHY